MKTYKQARADLLIEFKAMGWTISDTTLKVPHATRGDGHFRFWFKPQAVHYTIAHAKSYPHDRSDARCLVYDLDMRKVSAAMLAAMAFRVTG